MEAEARHHGPYDLESKATQTMTISDYAENTGRCTRTIRRWIRAGLLPSKRVPLGSDWTAFRYEIAEESIPLAEHIHGYQMRKLAGMSPGLGRYLKRRLGETDRTSAMRWGRHYDVPHKDQQAKCPRCGFTYVGP